MKMKSALMLGVNPNVERQKEDFYATNPNALRLFLQELSKDGIYLSSPIWECACGLGHLSEVLKEKYPNHMVKSSDIIDRGYGQVIDFLDFKEKWYGTILTNPPFKLAVKFVEKAMDIMLEKQKLILFLKIQFLESKERYNLFKKYPPKYVYLHSSRQLCCRDGDFGKYKSTTQFYAWYVWEKGWEKETRIRWIEPEIKEIIKSEMGRRLTE